MSSNDLLLLDRLFKHYYSSAGDGLSESDYFELFCSEQILKDDDLTNDDIRDGIVDGGHDGGIDAIYLFLNGSLYHDDTNHAKLGRNPTFRLVFIQSKKTSGFSEAALDKLIASAADLFDFEKKTAELQSVYNEAVLRRVFAFRDLYFEYIAAFPTVSIEFNYAAFAADVHPNVERKVETLKLAISKALSSAAFEFNFFTASALLEAARRPPSKSSSLKLSESPISTGQHGFVCLVNILDFYKFIVDDKGHLRSQLFEANVRDYQGETKVNSKIRTTLESPSNEDFWWLNNGVSMVCTEVSLTGKVLTVQDPEIVNGLQTSREIFNVLREKTGTDDKRNILVRVLTPPDAESRDRIINATNSQTPIPNASLRATDKIHRDIEEHLLSVGYYYDRRKNYYKNQGKPVKKIFSIPFVAQSVLACALFDPANARARPSSLIEQDDQYAKIFDVDYPLDLYLNCPLIVRTIEDGLRHLNDEYREHVNNVKFYVAMLCMLRICNVPKPKISQIATIDLANLTSALISDTASAVFKKYKNLGCNDQVAKGTLLCSEIMQEHIAGQINRYSTLGQGELLLDCND